MKVNITWKDVIYVGTILVGIAMYFIKGAREQGTLHADVKKNTEELIKVNEKLDKYGDYWMEQKEVNGAVITALGIDDE